MLTMSSILDKPIDKYDEIVYKRAFVEKNTNLSNVKCRISLEISMHAADIRTLQHMPCKAFARCEHTVKLNLW